MKNKLLIKLSNVISLSIIFLILTANFNVKAATVGEQNTELGEIINTEKKIMKYDLKTGKETEVDMEQLRNSLISLNNGQNLNVLDIKPLPPKYSSSSLVGTNATSSDVYTFPGKTVCRITFYNSQGELEWGSGSLVAYNGVLTCAHCVFDPDEDNFVYRSWKAYPGYTISNKNVSSSGWSSVYYMEDWKTSHKTEDDWAICVLESPIGESIGALGTKVLSDSELTSTSITITGYPNTSTLGELQMYDTGTVLSVSNKWFRVSPTIWPGMSGGPVTIPSTQIVGVVATRYNYIQGGQAVRVNSQMGQIILDLRNGNIT